jgi:hypothetical protein
MSAFGHGLSNCNPSSRNNVAAASPIASAGQRWQLGSAYTVCQPKWGSLPLSSIESAWQNHLQLKRTSGFPSPEFGWGQFIEALEGSVGNAPASISPANKGLLRHTRPPSGVNTRSCAPRQRRWDQACPPIIDNALARWLRPIRVGAYNFRPDY